MSVILIPVDGSTHSLKALHIACDLADKYGSDIALLNIIAIGRNDHPLNVDEADIVRGQQILERASVGAELRGIACNVLPIEKGDPAEAILISAKKLSASTIVMGCRGTTNGSGGSFGSVSQTVFARSECTCISVK